MLPGHPLAAIPLHAVYPHTCHLAPRVRRFVEFIGERLERTWREEIAEAAARH
ncbi:hypothetical protein GCM10027514_14260 [Azotobacter armeniacus]